jgi:uncharacterized repeat protein (TIGR01451 family)
VYQAGGALAVTNTILYSNTASITGGAVYSASASATNAMDYLNLWNNLPDDGNVPIGSNSLVAEPRFKDATSGDFHLTIQSPALDAGLAVSLATDFEGDARPSLLGFDIGADEFSVIRGWQLVPEAAPEQHTTASTVLFSHILSNTGNFTDTATLTATVDLPNWSVAVSPYPTVTLGPGLTTTVQVTVTTHPATTIGLAGTAIITAGSQATATARDVTWFQNEADLAIRKSVAPTGWLGPNDAFTYTLVYTNTGPADGVGVIITDTLPVTMTNNATYTFSGPALTRLGDGLFAWSVAESGIVSGTVGVITITGIVSPTPGVVALVANTAVITTSQNDIVPANNSATADAWIDSQSPIATGQPLVAPTQGTITFSRDIVFSWNADAFSDLSGSGIGGYEFAIGGSSGYTPVVVYSPTTSVAVNNLPYDVYTWTVRAFDNVGNVGEFVAPFDLIVDVPDLSVSKYAAPGTPVAGAPFTYYLTITNTASIAASGLVLSDTLPPNAQFISASSGGSRVGNDVVWSGLSVAPLGGTAQAAFIVSACQTVTNTWYRVMSTAEGVGSPPGDPVVTTSVMSPTINASFAKSTSSALAGAPVIFTDTTATDGALVAWLWDFGDGFSGSGAIVSHTYSLSGTYVVTMTAGDACNVRVPVTGTLNVIGAPDIAATPASISVSLPRNAVTTRTLTIDNTGSANLSWSLSESATWLAVSPMSGNIAPTGSATVVVTITAPNSAGTFNTNLTLASDDPDENPVTIPVQLVMLVPDITVSATPPLSVTLAPGETTTRILTISNIGADTLTWSLAENPSVGWLAEAPTGGGLAPLGNASVVVTFTAPLTTGPYSTALRITSNDPDTPTTNVPVSLLVSNFKVYLPAILKNK